MDKRVSEVIDLLRFPLMFGVVLVHCVPVGVLGTALTSILGQTCVPTFFVISGYLYFNGLTGDWSWSVFASKLRKRVSTLLIPYIIWNIVLALFICRSAILHFDLDGLYGFFSERGLLSVPLAYWHISSPVWWHALSDAAPSEFVAWWQPLHIPLWYIRDLMVLCVCSPFVYALVRGRHGRFVMGVMALLLVATGGWFPLRSLFFFSYGAFLRIHALSPVPSKRSLHVLSATALPLFIAALVSTHLNSELQTLFLPAFLLNMPALWFGVADRLVEHRHIHAVPVLTQSCFLILVLHFRPTLAYSDQLSHLLLSFLPASGLHDTLCYLLSPCIAVAVCVIIYMAMHRLMPRTLAFLTGGHA
ncbi:MAG: acyltransferase [Bacteroidaceae bacterium]|nr:acyltransferase [Bacteroidaceae bacterium]